jgi:acyl carrier protein
MQNFEESVMRNLWCEILGVDTVDDDTSFVELGGTSIAAILLAARISDLLGVDLSSLEILLDECYASFVQRVRSRVADESMSHSPP